MYNKTKLMKLALWKRIVEQCEGSEMVWIQTVRHDTAYCEAVKTS